MISHVIGLRITEVGFCHVSRTIPGDAIPKLFQVECLSFFWIVSWRMGRIFTGEYGWILGVWKKLGLFWLDGKLSLRSWKTNFRKLWLLGCFPQEIRLWVFILFWISYINTEFKKSYPNSFCCFWVGIHFLHVCLSVCRPYAASSFSLRTWD